MCCLYPRGDSAPAAPGHLPVPPNTPLHPRAKRLLEEPPASLMFRRDSPSPRGTNEAATAAQTPGGRSRALAEDARELLGLKPLVEQPRRDPQPCGNGALPMCPPHWRGVAVLPLPVHGILLREAEPPRHWSNLTLPVLSPPPTAPAAPQTGSASSTSPKTPSEHLPLSHEGWIIPSQGLDITHHYTAPPDTGIFSFQDGFSCPREVGGLKGALALCLEDPPVPGELPGLCSLFHPG